MWLTFFAYHYEPEVDVYKPLYPEIVSYYQPLIGIMQWMVKLGCIDIATEVSMLSSQKAYPCKGHFVVALHIMSYLKGRHNSFLDLELTYPAIVYEKFETEKNWTAFHGDVKEAIPPNYPTPFGKSIYLRMMVGSDHAGDKINRRYRTGFMIFVNLSLITWFSKKQPNAESAFF